ncbi:zinc finger protein [Trypanosoma melophagium]|uniref:zinc finger protein n=1 Tax=Trypanosoma melophagium TaxID=715481 RepID=UPI00351A94F2|nr:zinc finger protein [Trypanosoma melophagium]
MVSFTCGRCQDVVKKPKVLSHAHSCGAAGFTCVDCMEVFDLNTVKSHTACISETEKYQGKWRQKSTATAAVKKSKDSGSDSDNNNKSNINNNGKGHLMRPPRAPMDFSSDSDDDDDGWVKAKKSPQKRPRSENTSSQHSSTLTNVTKAKTIKSPKPAKSSKTIKKINGDGGHNNTRVKHEPLTLPRAMTSADCVVPSFVLGTDDEVAQVAGWIINEESEENGNKQQQLSVRDLAKKMVERYNARIAKHLRHAINTAIRNGKLREENGVVVVVSSK